MAKHADPDLGLHSLYEYVILLETLVYNILGHLSYIQDTFWHKNIYKKNLPLALYTYHWNSIAQTGRPQPNMSTTFIGRSRPLEDL